MLCCQIFGLYHHVLTYKQKAKEQNTETNELNEKQTERKCIKDGLN